MKAKTILLFITLNTLNCMGEAPSQYKIKDTQKLSYVETSSQSGIGGIDEVNACTLSGTFANVILGEIISSKWEERKCGEMIPDPRYRYKIKVLDDVFSKESGEIDILGLARYEVLPDSAKSGDKFLIAYRNERGINYIGQWVKIVEGEIDTVEREVLLPPTKGELFQDILDARGSSCKDKIAIFEQENFITSWFHKDCESKPVELKDELEPDNGVDL